MPNRSNMEMVVTCRSVLELPVASRLILLTDESGLDREIRWTHYVENPEYLDFLRGGELVFTTGMLVGGEGEMLALVEQLREKGAAGLVISQEEALRDKEWFFRVIQRANELHLSIFSLPWEIGMVDLIQTVCQAIFTASTARGNRDNFIYSLLTDEVQEGDRLLRTARTFGYDPQYTYCGAVVRLDLGRRPDRKDRDEMVHLVVGELYGTANLHQLPLLHLSQEQQILLVLPDTQRLSARAFLQEALQRVAWRQEDLVVTGGIGCPWEHLDQFKSSIKQAEQAVRLAPLRGEQVVSFLELDLLRLLCEVPDPQEIRRVYEQILGPLLQYDAQSGTQLKETLRQYLDSGESLAQTAEGMYLHINTLRYRLRRIGEILQCDLRDPACGFRLRLAFQLEDFLRCQSGSFAAT